MTAGTRVTHGNDREIAVYSAGHFGRMRAFLQCDKIANRRRVIDWSMPDSARFYVHLHHAGFSWEDIAKAHHYAVETKPKLVSTTSNNG